MFAGSLSVHMYLPIQRVFNEKEHCILCAMHGIQYTGAMVIIVGRYKWRYISVNRCIAEFHHTSTGVVKIQFSNLIVLKCKNMYYDQLEIFNAMCTPFRVWIWRQMCCKAWHGNCKVSSTYNILTFIDFAGVQGRHESIKPLSIQQWYADIVLIVI